MNDALVSMFRAIYGFLAWTVILVCATTGLLIAFSGQEMFRQMIGWGILFIGTPVAILAFGTVALMIQNNDHLRAIRDSLASPDTQARPAPATPPGKPPRASTPPIKRATPTEEPTLYKRNWIVPEPEGFRVGDHTFDSLAEAKQHIDLKEP